MSRRVEVLVDGIGTTVPNKERFTFRCCDCGLVHDMVLVANGGGKEIGIAVRRNKRATAQVRWHKCRPCSP